MTRIVTLAFAGLLLCSSLALAQNPVLGTVEGQSITLDLIQDGQLYKLRQQMYGVFRERLQGWALTRLAKDHPQYTLQPVAVTDTDLKQYYGTTGAAAYGTLDQVKPKLEAWIAARKAHDQLEALWARALAAGLVTDQMTPPAPFVPKVAVRPRTWRATPRLPYS